ncbi:SemiSWEET family sugar transporter [Aquimarina algiphila]|uniref:SemiSWEET family sugar transporter n=1 Tax=Aquimarina algiphila TaxID=2047982 RepID=UPI00232EA9A0|nr:SemiSWEET family transporter [Aquimarina algiphila]
MNLPLEELLGFIAAGLSSCSFIPQVYRVHKTKSVKSLSLFMLGISIIAGILWVTYGIYIKSIVLIISSSFTTTLHVSLAYLKVKFKTLQPDYSGYYRIPKN